MTPEIRNLLKEARTIIRAHARWSAKDWDERATKALATPPQRTWVGLTDDDWKGLAYDTEFFAGAAWAEAKLKEKNT
jgi:sulfur relay (sulfurtransferase) DsrC/TusE family protein